MLDVYICVGSSCHLKGSYYIIRAFQDLIKANKIEDKVQIKASFCLGHCTEGVCAKINDTYMTDITPENAESKFEEYVLGRLKHECDKV